MRTLLLRAALVVLLGVLPATVHADGWKWNPLAGRPKTTSLPLMNGKPLVRSAKSNPAVTSQVAGGAKWAAQGAVDLVTLKPLRSAISHSPKQSPAWKPYTPQMTTSTASSRRKSSDDSTFLSSWFGNRSKQEPQKPASNSWLFDNERSRP
jgi:hypothetical protein